MKLKTFLQTLLAVAFLTVASVLHAQSEQVQLGYYDGQGLEIDMFGNTSGSFTIYQDGQAVLSGDEGGVTYAAPSISYYVSGNTWPLITVSGLQGNISFDLNCMGQGSYSVSNTSIQWTSNWGWSYFYLTCF